MGYKENKRKYVLEYQKEHYASVVFHLRKEEDKDVLEFLKGFPNKSKYLIELIKKDMKTRM